MPCRSIGARRWRTGLRYLWAAPATALGVLAALPAVACSASARVVDGVLEVAGGRLCARAGSGPAALGFVAITFGHVVIGRSHAVLAGLRAHEHEHVRQYERWGALFFVAYLGSSAAQWLRGRSPYRHNRFERQARAAQHAALVQLARRRACANLQEKTAQRLRRFPPVRSDQGM